MRHPKSCMVCVYEHLSVPISASNHTSENTCEKRRAVAAKQESKKRLATHHQKTSATKQRDHTGS
jgi:hypothetical protein